MERLAAVNEERDERGGSDEDGGEGEQEQDGEGEEVTGVIGYDTGGFGKDAGEHRWPRVARFRRCHRRR
ncbi:hypothetical protein IEQ34_002462 [Dendrobium chrysotoxum]|uniref:Uncharacterized protein n=1 Tax=Dendrobium chrysotoxum TaxID=161865 RepID=A0AAV7H503_DENCH|nr:hypothetical protein IEQ34_002462 [Dendrobium chrysotoxum]